MKYLISLSLLIFSVISLQGQSVSDALVSSENAEYLEWVSENGFRFISEIKEGEETLHASEVLDDQGNPISSDVVASTFDITKYDFNEIVAPAKNIIIKISEGKGIFIYSKHRQEVLFNRYLINLEAKNQN